LLSVANRFSISHTINELKQPLIIATRGSDLALWQANYVKTLLEGIGLTSELKIVKTQGDEVQHLSLDKLEGKGFFTKEVEDALLNNEADIAVHSHKDLPTESPAGLTIAAVTNREDPSELLIIRKECVDAKQKFSLKKNAEIGTSSARRKSQMLAFRKDIKLKDLRGNVPGRVRKLREGQYDAILIAFAGVERLELDLSDLHVEKLDVHEFIPAPAQGVMAVQIRKSDTALFDALQKINRKDVQRQVAIERKILNLFEAGCHAPVGAFAEYDDEKEMWKLIAAKADSWEKMPVSVYLESKNAAGLAERAVEKIRNIKPASVFITRNIKGDDYFSVVFTGNGFTISGHSLIDFEKIPLKDFPKTDWIFFSSKRAVIYFFGQKPKITDQKIGCIGKSTADEIRKFGTHAEFIGTSADTRLTGKQFASRVGDGTVLFPMAKGSLRSIQNGFVKAGQVIDLPIYETIEHNEFEIPYAEILVFTSPSNVQSYIKKNSIDKKQKLIALGDATGSALRKLGFTQYITADAFDDTALARSVFNVSSK
jgi:hydroxymethylbilane synthase